MLSYKHAKVTVFILKLYKDLLKRSNILTVAVTKISQPPKKYSLKSIVNP